MYEMECEIAAHKDDEFKRWHSDNLNTDCAAFPESNCFAVTNNVDSEQTTTIHDQDGETFKVSLSPHEMKWFSIQ